MKCEKCKKYVLHNEQLNNVCHDCARQMIFRGANVEAALKEAVWFLYTRRHRGPFHKRWKNVMRQVAEALEWETCKKCEGTGSFKSYVCNCCSGIGKCDGKA